MRQGVISAVAFAGPLQAEDRYLRDMEVLQEAVGQEALTARLFERADAGTLAHAMLFTGPPGRGGLALALALARRLHCTSPQGGGACGVCPACQQHAQFQHPDLHFTFPVIKAPGKDKALSADQLGTWRALLREVGPHFDMADLRERMALGNKQPFISVHEAADILRRLSLTAHAGGWKVQIIWGAHAMRTDTANKLLKVIEEPPAKTVFILMADSTENLLATILSRTQIVPVPPVEPAGVQQWLAGMQAQPDKVSDAVALCEGDLAKARRLVSEDAAGEFAMFVDWMRTNFARDGRKATAMADAFHDLGREDQKQFLAFALHMVRQCIVGNYGAAGAVKLRASERSFAEKFAPYIHHGNVVEMQAELEKAARDVTGNVYGRTVFLDLSMKMMELLHRAR